MEEEEEEDLDLEEEEDDEEEEEDDEEDDEEEDDEEDDDEEDEEKPYPELYVLDDVASEDGELRATLILDEISEFYEKDEDAPNGGTKYYKIMVHVYNSGFAPICSALLSLTETAVVEQAWTAEEVEEGTNVFEVLWVDENAGISPDNPRSMSRFVGFVTVGDVVPEIKIDSIEPCGEEDDGDEEDEEEEEEGEEGAEEDEEDEEEETTAAALLRFMSAGGAAARDKALEKVWNRDEEYPEDVLFNVDDAALLLLTLEVDEARSTLDDHGISSSAGAAAAGGLLHDVLVTARVTNTADHPVCGIGLWVHNLHKARSYFSLLPVMDAEGKRTDVALLPSVNSTLAAGATQFFSVIFEDMDPGFPNMAVVTASEECTDATASEYALGAAAAKPK